MKPKPGDIAIGKYKGKTQVAVVDFVTSDGYVCCKRFTLGDAFPFKLTIANYEKASDAADLFARMQRDVKKKWRPA